LANAGHDTRALQAWLGHKNIQHTVRYTEWRPIVSRAFGGAEQYSRAVMTMLGSMDWHLALAVGLLTGFIVGFASGYGIRAFISFRRYYAALAW
jgi:hypothetical protein